MSKLQVDDIVNKDDTGSVGFSRGVVVTGVMTATSFSGGASGDFSVEDKIVHTGDTNTSIRFPEADTFTVETAGTERLRTDSSGNLILGHTSAIVNMKYGGSGDFGSQSYVAGGNKGFGNGLAILNYDATASIPASLKLGTSRNDTVGVNTVVGNADDNCASIQFMGNDGTRFIDLARIDGVVDGTVGTDDMPGRLSFFTTADGASVVTERMRIHNGGVVSFNNGIELGSGLDATAANTLDDYETGTWTPSIGGNATYTTQAGNYIKVGTMVLAHFQLTINTKGTGSTIGAISGLPFSSTKASQNTSNLTWGSLNTNIIYGVYYVGSGTQTMYFSYSASAAGSLTNNPDIFQDGASVNGTLIYIA